MRDRPYWWQRSAWTPDLFDWLSIGGLVLGLAGLVLLVLGLCGVFGPQA